MKTRKWFYTATLAILCACGGSKQNSETADGCKIIPIDLADARPLDLTEFVERITFIPLETNDISLIGSDYSLQVRNGKLFVGNYTRDELLAFDGQGKFLFTTRPHFGQGLEDYVRAKSIYVDGEENISIYEDPIPRIQLYDNQLNRLAAHIVKVPDHTRSFMQRVHARLNDSTYLMRDVKDIHFYSLTQDTVVKSIHHEFPDLLSYTTHIRFTDYNGKFYFSHHYSNDTLFHVDEASMTLKPVVIFDFGGESFNLKDLPSSMTAEYYMKYIVETEKVTVLEKIHFADKALCYFMKKGKGTFLSYTSDRLQAVYQATEDTPIALPKAIEGNKLYAMVMPDKIEDYIHPDLVDEESLKRIADLKEDDNQVVICYELK